MYLIFVSLYKKNEPFLTKNDPRFTLIRNTDEKPSDRSTDLFFERTNFALFFIIFGISSSG